MLNVIPGARFPLAKAPVSEVTVCVTPSLLIQVTATLFAAGNEKEPGSKENPEIETPAVLPPVHPVPFTKAFEIPFI